jgi:trigger factor
LKSEARDTGPQQKELDIHLDAEEVLGFIDERVGAYRRNYAIPGFRPGKAPDQIVRARFHEEIERALMTELVPRSIDQVYAERRIRPAAPSELLRMRYQPGEPLTFSIRVDVWPDVELKPYEDLSIDQVVEDVGPEEVEAFLANLRDRVAEQNPVERAAQDGDILDGELEVLDEAGTRMKGTKRERLALEVGAQNLLAGFLEVGRGMTAGDTREFEVQYPDDYGQEDLRGQKKRYKLRAVQIREKKVPQLDDQLAQRLDPNLDLGGLRARVRLRLEGEKRFAARERLEEAIVQRLTQENPFSVPEVAIERALERLIAKLREDGAKEEPEEIRKAYRPWIERVQKRDFLLARVAEREGIRVGPEEVEAEIGRLAQEQHRTVEQVRSEIGDLDRFEQFLYERRVFDALLGKVQVRQMRMPTRVTGAEAEVGPVEVAGPQAK